MPTLARSARSSSTPRKGAFHIKSPALAPQGRLKILWAESQMPVVLSVRRRFARAKPLRGLRIGCCLHVTSETASLVITLKAAGAEVALCASNPLSTQDDVAASLVRHDHIPVFAVRGEDRSTYYRHIESVLFTRPHLTMDDGADLISSIHRRFGRFGTQVFGGTEETTTGVIRLRSLAAQGKLRYPVIAVNDAKTKQLFDNRYGTGQSTIDGILRATNRLLAGSTFVVCGYGWCGKGLAQRARGMGAHVVVTEVDSIKGLEALMDGFRVMTLRQAAPIADIVVTVTGCCAVIREEHLRRLKDGALIANAGHFDVEIDLEALRRLSRRRLPIRTGLVQYVLRGGRRVNLLGEGRLVNLAVAEGHPSSVMDLSFANQALACEYLSRQGKRLAPNVYPVPEAIDRSIARMKLGSLGVAIDRLTPAQSRYLGSWELGT